ncbi:MAG: hypothetical protein COB67_07465 [SAR324 cluster bacterium]|uniref:Methyltransferase n=1 Tax=SAR324 cluster bacterium TaxID=2024889 RepID=A0A2A4T3F2_9DELT|nr:MAG: hypothetical protein COB67_07465 [SAR324 cluster bacterium]
MEDFYQKALHYLEPFHQQVPTWLQKIKVEGIQDRVPIVRDDMGQYLKSICSLLQPERILEIGCGISYSTHWMLWGSPGSQVVAIDSNHVRLAQCKEYLKESGFEDQVDLRHCWAEDFFLENQQQFDLIFQDSTKKGYSKMIEPIHRSLKVGGVLIVDNIFYNGKTLEMTEAQEKKYAKGVALVNEFNQKISQHPGFQCTFLPLSDGTLLAKRIA